MGGAISLSISGQGRLYERGDISTQLIQSVVNAHYEQATGCNLPTIALPTPRLTWPSVNVQMHGIAETLPVSPPTSRHVHVTVIALEKSSWWVTNSKAAKIRQPAWVTCDINASGD